PAAVGRDVRSVGVGGGRGRNDEAAGGGSAFTGERDVGVVVIDRPGLRAVHHRDAVGADRVRVGGGGVVDVQNVDPAPAAAQEADGAAAAEHVAGEVQRIGARSPVHEQLAQAADRAAEIH